MQETYLYNLIRFYSKRWLIIISVTFFGLVLGFVYSNYIQTPMYKSEATLLLVQPNSATNRTVQDVTLINNYIELFKSRRVLEPVIEKQKLNTSYNDIVGLVEASSSANTEVIKVAVSTNDPQKSKDFLASAVGSFKSQVSQLYKVDNVKIVDSASLASEPYNIHKELLSFGMAAVCFIGVFVVMFFAYDYNFIKQSKIAEEDMQKKQVLSEQKVVMPVGNPQQLCDAEIDAHNVDDEADTTTMSTHIDKPLVTVSRAVRDRPFPSLYARERQFRR